MLPLVTRLSSYFLPTLKEPPADAEAISHVLMVRAGLVRQLGAGMWTWLPAGWRVHRRGSERDPRGDGRDRGAGDADAGAAAGGALAADRAAPRSRSCSSCATATTGRWCSR